MNKTVKIFGILFCTLMMTACVQDLNTEPIDKNSNTSFNQAQMFTKCYAALVTTGQKPQDDCDIEDLDPGTSSFFRTICYMNELTSDESWWNWQDAGVADLCVGNWTGINDLVQGIYARMNINNKYFNHFIKYADQSNVEGANQVAEVRFLRALHYCYIMDLFLYAPFCIEESTEYPNFIPRHELYDWLVNKELPEVISLLPDQRANMWRVDKAAGYLLMARVCLNAAVYNKYNPNWTEQNTKDAWQAAYDNANLAVSTPAGYGLYEDNSVHPKITYSAYQKMFMGDNAENGAAAKEGIMVFYCDGIYCRSWGGSKFLLMATRKTGMGAYGLTGEEPWKSLRTSPTLPRKFYSLLEMSDATAGQIKQDEWGMSAALKDDRAIFCSYTDTTFGKTKKEWLLQGKQRVQSDDYFYDCWSGCKYTNVYSTAAHPSLSIGTDKSWPDCDVMFMRAAEAYLTMAEAKFRLGDKGAALSIINTTVRKRAHAAELKDLTEESLLDEWSREFWFEGRRRMDLVRFDRFYGAASDAHSYTWEGRAGVNDGNPFKAGTDDYRNWFPVPTKDKNANPNFKKQVMENPSNIFAGQGGDGYAL